LRTKNLARVSLVSGQVTVQLKHSWGLRITVFRNGTPCIWTEGTTSSSVEPFISRISFYV
jgi:hypothetical protein